MDGAEWLVHRQAGLVTADFPCPASGSLDSRETGE
jgi:hypothetical protein